MTSSNPTDTAAQQQVRIYSAYESFKHNASLTMLVLAPVLILIPPRKLDLYTFSLTGAFVASANQLTVERTGKGLLSQFGYGGMSPFATELQRQSAEDKGQRRLLEERPTVPGEVLKRSTGSKVSLENKARELWMGGESEGWKEKRLREEQEKLNQGEGYGSMIVDQIWEVWNQGEKQGEEIKEKDEEVLDQRKRERTGKRTP